jgi:hypothetical protein
MTYLLVLFNDDLMTPFTLYSMTVNNKLEKCASCTWLKAQGSHFPEDRIEEILSNESLYPCGGLNPVYSKTNQWS